MLRNPHRRRVGSQVLGAPEIEKLPVKPNAWSALVTTPGKGCTALATLSILLHAESIWVTTSQFI
jgi:hypothetical protein